MEGLQEMPMTDEQMEALFKDLLLKIWKALDQWISDKPDDPNLLGIAMTAICETQAMFIVNYMDDDYPGAVRLAADQLIATINRIDKEKKNEQASQGD